MMGYSIIHNKFAVTANLELISNSNTCIKEFEIFAWVKDIDGKKIYTESLIKSDEQTHVESSAMFIDLGLDAAEFLHRLVP